MADRHRCGTCGRADLAGDRCAYRWRGDKTLYVEGARRRISADEGIAALKEQVDTLITIPNDRLFQIAEKKTTMQEAFRIADDVLRQGIQGISDLIIEPGMIKLDFADQ